VSKGDVPKPGHPIKLDKLGGTLRAVDSGCERDLKGVRVLTLHVESEARKRVYEFPFPGKKQIFKVFPAA
jgi:hypothetical protein